MKDCVKWKKIEGNESKIDYSKLYLVLSPAELPYVARWSKKDKKFIICYGIKSLYAPTHFFEIPGQKLTRGGWVTED